MSTRAPFCEAVAIWIKSNVLHIVKSENCPVLQVHLSLNPPTKECLSKYCPGPQERILLSDILEKTILSSNCLATSAASCHLFEPLETTWKIAWDKVAVTSKSLKETTIKKVQLEKFYTVQPSVKSSINFCCRPHYILLWHSLDTKKANTLILVHPNRHREVVKSTK